MKPKRPTDKDLRLYARLSDVDPALIADSAIPEPAPHLSPVTPPVRKPSGLRSLLARPWAASLAVSTAMLSLVLAALLAMGGFREPTVESPSHSAHPDTLAPLPGETVSPSLENAAALRKGMSLSELVSLMGNNYTQEGTRYTFTLDTGEQLAVDTEYIYGGNVGSRVTGFEWLGNAGKTYNPMGIPAEILQKVQDYATDRVIPVYAMSSLIGQYDSATPPTLDEILKDAEVHYLRTGADGETALLDGEGHGAGGYTQDEAFSFLADVSALFDDSVRVKGYYPIATSSLTEGEAVYLQTSIGDYILYLHEDVIFVLEGDDPPANDPVPYLLPVGVFHRFAYGMVDQSVHYGIGWAFTEERMAIIEPYKMTAEGYQKPVNIATPEAAEQVEVGMQIDFYGNTLTALLGNGHATMSERMKGIFYWELTDGRGFVVTAKTVESYSGIGDVCAVTSVGYFDSAEMLEDLGQPSLANAALIREGVSLVVAEAVMGAHNHLLVPLSVPCVWSWQEEGHIHTLTIDWRLYTTGGSIRQEKTEAKSVTLSKLSASAAAAQVKVGMTQADLVNLMGKSDSTPEQQALGILYWKRDEGKSLFVYCRPEDTSRKDPPSIVANIVWLDSPSILNRLGSPSYDVASLIVEGMSREAVTALMGKEISYSYSSGSQLSVSGWSFDHDGLPREFNVYWETVVTASLQTEKRVQAATLTESWPPDTKPIASLAQAIQIGMTDIMVLNALGGFPTEVFDCGEGFLYIWELNNGRFFGTVLEDRTPDDDGVIQLTVTQILFCDSMEEMAQYSSVQS